MPLYSYLCRACGPFTELAPISMSAEPQACPACGEPGARALSLPSVRSAETTGPAPTRGARRAPSHARDCACCGLRPAARKAEGVATPARVAKPPAFLAD